MWPDRRIIELFGIEVPLVQAPMAGASGPELLISVSEAGGLGSLPCAMLGPEQARTELALIRERTARPINVNFFCHTPPPPDPQREAEWRARLAPYYAELGIDGTAVARTPVSTSFNEAFCEVVEEFTPEVVSFHFGLPSRPLLERVRATGAKVVSSATTVAEAQWLEAQGCDAIIAQGFEAGGHRGMFLARDIATQAGTLALVPQIVDCVKVPVIAAGGIGDARGIAAAFALGAAAVQMGTAYLFCPEARTTALHRARLTVAADDDTALTNVVHRTTSALPVEPDYARTGADDRGRAGIPSGCRPDRPVARQGGGGRLRRLQSTAGGAGRGARSRSASRPANARSRCRCAAAARSFVIGRPLMGRAARARPAQMATRACRSERLRPRQPERVLESVFRANVKTQNWAPLSRLATLLRCARSARPTF
jgi:nitronate monooxygenase